MISVIQQGLIFSLVACAVYVTSRVLKKDDLTVEGSFGIAGAITAMLLKSHISPLITMLAAIATGGAVGCMTGWLYCKLKMNHLMAGLISSTACFSLSLALASANQIIAPSTTIFSLPLIANVHSETIIVFAVSLIALLGLMAFMRTELGLLMRAVGDNPAWLLHLGKASDRYYMAGFALANAFTALAGSLFVQWSGFFSITGSVGTLVSGLATLMIAELMMTRLSLLMMAAAILYQSIFMATLMIGLPPTWNNLVKAIIMIGLIALARVRTRAGGTSHA